MLAFLCQARSTAVVRSLTIGALTLLLIAACAPTPPATDDAAAPAAATSAARSAADDPASTPELQACLDRIRTNSNTPGALLTVAPTTESTNLTSGLANLAEQRPIVTEDQFRIGSISKTYVATAVLQLVGQGKLQLTDTLAALLGSAVAGIPNADAITVTQLLNMTSGVQEYNTAEFQAALFKNPGKIWTPEELIATIAGKPALFAPDATCEQCGRCYDGPGVKTCWSYSNTNYILLGMIIEKVTGQALSVALAEQLLQPLSLTRTLLPATPALTPPFSSGYMPALRTREPTDVDSLRDVTGTFSPTVAWAAGGMISNIPDLERWLPALLSGSQITPALHKAQLTFVNGDLEGTQIGYGLGVMLLDGFQGHGGEFFGFATVAMQSPTCQQQIIDMVNLFPELQGSSFLDIFLSADNILCNSGDCLVQDALSREQREALFTADAEPQYRGSLWAVYDTF